MSLQGAAGLEYVSLFGRQRRGVHEVPGTPTVIPIHWAAELQMFHVKRARDKGVTCWDRPVARGPFGSVPS